jgi:hypothetical protein
VSSIDMAAEYELKLVEHAAFLVEFQMASVEVDQDVNVAVLVEVVAQDGAE